MSKSIVMDEFHVTAYVPRGLPDAEYRAIRLVLDDRRFQADLRRAVRGVFRSYADLSKVRVTVAC